MTRRLFARLPQPPRSRMGRRGLAAGFGLGANLVLIAAILASQHRGPAAVERPMQLVIIPAPRVEKPPRPHAGAGSNAQAPAPKTPVWIWDLPRHEPPPSASPAPAGAAPPSLGGVGPGALSDLDAAVIPSIHWLRNCAGGYLDRLPQWRREQCAMAMLKFRPDGRSGPLGLKDPHGEFARAAAEAAARRAPMLQAPIHPCNSDRAGSNLGASCGN